MKQKVFRTGHSLAVVVPSKFVKDIALKAGDEVTVHTDEQSGTVTYIFPNITQLSLELGKK